MEKGISIPVQAQKVEAPRFLDSRHMKVVRLSAPLTCRPNPPTQEIFLVLISVRLSRPQIHSAAGRMISMKNSGDTIGNQRATFRLLAQCLIQLCHRVPHMYLL